MAVELSYGWPEGPGSFEDYTLALEMTRDYGIQVHGGVRCIHHVNGELRRR